MILTSFSRRCSPPNGKILFTCNQLYILLTLLTCLSFWTPCASVGIIDEESNFCYDDVNPDCPDPSNWPGFCNDGSNSQSPIRLPTSSTTSDVPRSIDLNLTSYKGSTFRMQNNGHTVTVKLNTNQEANSAEWALTKWEGEVYSQYKLGGLHFHWGRNDSVGSEHCLKNKCFSMEMHLVHYQSKFRSLVRAIESQDPNALAVIGIFLEVSEKYSTGNPALAPIIKHLHSVIHPSHTEWTDVFTALDLGPILAKLATGGNVATYNGSLTTPDCNEIVNWYVFQKPLSLSHEDVKMFRYLKDIRGQRIKQNHRPLQQRNGRSVYSVTVRQFIGTY